MLNHTLHITLLLSSISQRDGNKVSMDKIDAINEQFRNIADKTEGVEYINHDYIFRCEDGSIDSSTLMLDQLSSKETKKLIENLGLKEQTKSTTGNKQMLKKVNNDTVGGHFRRSQIRTFSCQ